MRTRTALSASVAFRPINTRSIVPDALGNASFSRLSALSRKLRTSSVTRSDGHGTKDSDVAARISNRKRYAGVAYAILANRGFGG